jgi:hypothetical protein
MGGQIDLGVRGSRRIRSARDSLAFLLTLLLIFRGQGIEKDKVRGSLIQR